MSLLLANGHPLADQYHIGRVFDEAKLVVDRRNGELATLGVVIQAAGMTTSMGATKKSAANFQKLIKTLGDAQ